MYELTKNHSGNNNMPGPDNKETGDTYCYIMTLCCFTAHVGDFVHLRLGTEVHIYWSVILINPVTFAKFSIFRILNIITMHCKHWKKFVWVTSMNKSYITDIFLAFSYSFPLKGKYWMSQQPGQMIGSRVINEPRDPILFCTFYNLHDQTYLLTKK